MGDNPDVGSLIEQFAPQVVSHVNLTIGRVGPNFSLDLATSAEFHRKESRSEQFQLEAKNTTDLLNVINFASLFFRRAKRTMGSRDLGWGGLE